MNIIQLGALIALITLALLPLFQIALIAGAPIGKFAWGGKHEVLPIKLRISSAISILLYVIFALLVASKSTLLSLIPASALLDIGIWVITGYFILGVGLNAISRSKSERFTMTPVALILAITFFIVASS